MHFTTGYENRRSRIEIVPLIDVVFLLLVFFIYAMLSMTVYRGLRVALPRGAGVVEEIETIVITIREDDTLWIDATPVTLPEAVGAVAARVRTGEAPVLISGDREAGLGVSVELLAALRRAGVEQVSFQVAGEE